MSSHLMVAWIGPIIARGDDKLVWKLSSKGGFEMRSAYLLATNSLEDHPPLSPEAGFGKPTLFQESKLLFRNACITVLELKIV